MNAKKITNDILRWIRPEAVCSVTMKDFELFNAPPTKERMEQFVSIACDDLGISSPSLEITPLANRNVCYLTMCLFVTSSEGFKIVVNEDALHCANAAQLYMSLGHECRHLSQFLLCSLLDTEHEELLATFMARLGISSVEICRQMKSEFENYKRSANVSYLEYRRQLVELDANTYSTEILMRLFKYAILDSGTIPY